MVIPADIRVDEESMRLGSLQKLLAEGAEMKLANWLTFVRWDAFALVWKGYLFWLEGIFMVIVR